MEAHGAPPLVLLRDTGRGPGAVEDLDHVAWDSEEQLVEREPRVPILPTRPVPLGAVPLPPATAHLRVLSYAFPISYDVDDGPA
jgi:hypothetical protein